MQWELEKNYFLDSRNLELYFQLELNIKELLEKHQVVFVSEWVSTLKTVCICVPFFFCYHCTKNDNNLRLTNALTKRNTDSPPPSQYFQHGLSLSYVLCVYISCFVVSLHFMLMQLVSLNFMLQQHIRYQNYVLKPPSLTSSIGA